MENGKSIEMKTHIRMDSKSLSQSEGPSSSWKGNTGLINQMLIYRDWWNVSSKSEPKRNRKSFPKNDL